MQLKISVLVFVHVDEMAGANTVTTCVLRACYLGNLGTSSMQQSSKAVMQMQCVSHAADIKITRKSCTHGQYAVL